MVPKCNPNVTLGCRGGGSGSEVTPQAGHGRVLRGNAVQAQDAPGEYHSSVLANISEALTPTRGRAKK